MKTSYNNCDCLEKLILIGKIRPYTSYSDLSNYAQDVEEGTLCFVNQKIEDNGDYYGINWISNIEIRDELFPINNCPICGREIKYKELNDSFLHKLTKEL